MLLNAVVTDPEGACQASIVDVHKKGLLEVDSR